MNQNRNNPISMAKSSSGQEKHIAVFAFPFGSHPRPLLNLVVKLASATPNVLYSFFGTAKSNASLFSPSSNLNIPSNITAYNVADGVPSCHTLSKNPLEAVEMFLRAGPENCRRSIEMVVAETGRKITCLVTDAFLTFAGKIAQDFQASWIPVWLPMPSCLSAHLHTDLIRKMYGNNIAVCSEQILEVIPGLSMMRVKDLPEEVLSNDQAEDSIFAEILSQVRVLSQAIAVAVNCYEELNPEALNYDLKSKFPNLLHVGFLSSICQLPLKPPTLSDLDETGCLSWLDRQMPASVAYVSFGTIATPPPNELAALADALEESGIPFLWSLKENLIEILPNGFVERTKKIGKMVPWAPQTHVLAHRSVGVFITHCGWNSVCESIVCGVPMVYRPLFGDHRMIGQMVEHEWGIGVMVEGGVFSKSGLLKSMEFVLGDEKGKKLRKKVQDLKEVVIKAAGPNGSATKNIKTLVEIISES